MRNETNACRNAQDALLESFILTGESLNISADLRLHLEGCASCRQYFNNLGLVRSDYPKDSFYSPFLRAKTLRRLANRDEAIKVEWLPLVVFASLLSLSISYGFPAWFLSSLFTHWTSSAGVSYGASLGITLLLGVLVTVIFAISLIEREYIHLSNGERIPDPGNKSAE